MTVAELEAAVCRSIDEIRADIEVYDERLAIQYAEIDDGLTTTQRAIAVLQRVERFRGEHDVARAWLRDCAPTAGIFRRVSA